LIQDLNKVGYLYRAQKNFVDLSLVKCRYLASIIMQAVVALHLSANVMTILLLRKRRSKMIVVDMIFTDAM